MYKFLILGAVGLLLCVLGYMLAVNKNVKILHSYQLKGVKDIKTYCSLMGALVIIIGLVFLISSVLGFTGLFTLSYMKPYILALCFLDVLFILITQKKFSGHII